MADRWWNAMQSEQDAYDELSAYTLMYADTRFIHQHVVDAWAAQHANSGSKPISVAFSLAGLYLHVERGFSGREVQLAHMRMARLRSTWPTFELPHNRGDVTARDVMLAPEGAARDRAIDAWCAAVWAAFAPQRALVVSMLSRHGVL